MPRPRKTQLQPRSPSADHARWWWLAVGLVVATGLVGIGHAFGPRILPGVRIGNVPVGGLTLAEAKHRLEQELASRQVTLVYQDRTWKPSYRDLGLVFDLVPPLHQAYGIGRFSPLPRWFAVEVRRQAIPISYTWTNDGLVRYLSQIIAAVGSPPVEPAVTFRDGHLVVSLARAGLVIDDEAFQEQLHAAARLGQAATLALEPKIEWPDVEAGDFVPAIAQAEARLGQPLTLRVNGQDFPIDTGTLAGWFQYDTAVEQPGQVAIAVNEAAIGSYIFSLATKVNVEPQPQQVLVSANNTETITPGSSGRRLNVPQSVALVSTAVLNPALAAPELPMDEVPAPTLHATTPPAPLPTGKVIAVDISKQMEFVYQDGTLVYSSKVSTGINDWTPTGSFRVYAKTKKQKMSGPDYYVPNVPNILWFKGDYSLHGVYWHNDFGIRPRSHGCVGQPLDTAAWLFDWADVGTPVVIYKS